MEEKSLLSGPEEVLQEDGGVAEEDLLLPEEAPDVVLARDRILVADLLTVLVDLTGRDPVLDLVLQRDADLVLVLLPLAGMVLPDGINLLDVIDLLDGIDLIHLDKEGIAHPLLEDLQQDLQQDHPNRQLAKDQQVLRRRLNERVFQFY